MAGLTPMHGRGTESSDRWHAVTAGFLGWTLDAFDFFVVIFLLDVLAEHFHVSKGAIVLSVTGTLAMRPVGRADLRNDGRSLRSSPSADGQRHLLLRGRTAVWLRSQLHRVLHPAPAVRNRHGRRVGRWRLTRDGACSREAGEACCRASCRAATRSATCWPLLPRASCYPTSAGAPCSGSAAFPRCWRFTSGPKCRSRKRGSSIGWHESLMGPGSPCSTSGWCCT